MVWRAVLPAKIRKNRVCSWGTDLRSAGRLHIMVDIFYGHGFRVAGSSSFSLPFFFFFDTALENDLFFSTTEWDIMAIATALYSLKFS